MRVNSMNLVITEAVYKCKEDVYSDIDKIKYFSEGQEYKFKTDDLNNWETWLITKNDLGQSHVISEMVFQKDENGDVVDGEWDFEFIDMYFELVEILCRGEV